MVVFTDGHPRILQVTLDVILAYIKNSPDRQRINESDFKEILNIVIDKIGDQLSVLLWKLSDHECYVIWLISRKISLHEKTFEYSIEQLRDWANEHHTAQKFDLKEGIADLMRREWSEWKNEDKKLFRFKLGIFPVWIRRCQLECRGIMYNYEYKITD